MMTEVTETPKQYNQPDGVMAEAGLSNNFYLVHVGRKPNPADPEDKGIEGTGAEVQATIRWPNLWDFTSFNHYAAEYLKDKARQGWRIKTRELAQVIPLPPPAKAVST